ncbi:MAG: pallilysin-related adhesin [Treponema pedis]|uniref:pallilysin-related adhesin n=1 Tax=Treponema pedis TaxID=409322 RepID=UPI003133DAB6
MFKKTLYALSVAAVFIVFAAAFYFQMKKNNTAEEIKPATKTIIPSASSKMEITETKNDTVAENTDTKFFLELSNDEVFVDAISGDLNGDGVEDHIAAVKKLLDPFVYLIISVQDPITQKRNRIEEIRTTITHPKSLTFYIIEPENFSPLLFYSGMTSDNGQHLSLHIINKNEESLSFRQIADLHADIQIRLQEADSQYGNKTGLDAYKILAYNSDPLMPNTLNQIQTEYVWNSKTGNFEKSREQHIPGEKIESQLLRKLQTGNTESFMDFLSELWYQSENGKKSGRTIYVDKNDKNIIFNLDNIEEIYEIKSTLPRRYGLFFLTNNKSIPNIIRRVEVEIKGIDEIQIRIIEDVARIKFGAASLWNGIYKKNTGIVQPEKTEITMPAETIRKKIAESEIKWESQNGISIFFSGNKYILVRDEKRETGYFNTIGINDKTVLQIKKETGVNKFYLISFKEKNKKQAIVLTRIKLNMNEITPTGDEPLVFTREIN